MVPSDVPIAKKNGPVATTAPMRRPPSSGLGRIRKNLRAALNTSGTHSLAWAALYPIRVAYNMGENGALIYQAFQKEQE